MSDILVKLADAAVANGNDGGLAVYGLGATVAVFLYDETNRVGGCLHFMLPRSTSSYEQAREYPFMFADTAIPRLLDLCLKAGAHRRELTARLAGGADLMKNGPCYGIGKENLAAAQSVLARLGIAMRSGPVGGSSFRTVRLDAATGRLHQKRHGAGWEIWDND